jgi:hypothetical protein
VKKICARGSTSFTGRFSIMLARATRKACGYNACFWSKAPPVKALLA